MSLRLKGSEEVMARIVKRSSSLSPKNPALRAVLIKAAALINARATLNLRKEQMVLTGRLLNSFKYEFFDAGTGSIGVYIGSFGVPYARLMEEGGTYTPAMRKAMFANLRKSGKLNGIGKGILNKSQLRARPFLQPAFEHSKNRIMELLSQEIS
jgi:hypothetical protein